MCWEGGAPGPRAPITQEDMGELSSPPCTAPHHNMINFHLPFPGYPAMPHCAATQPPSSVPWIITNTSKKMTVGVTRLHSPQPLKVQGHACSLACRNPQAWPHPTSLAAFSFFQYCHAAVAPASLPWLPALPCPSHG